MTRKDTATGNIADYLADRVKSLGGDIRIEPLPGHRGAPDRRVMLPGRQPVWVELLAPGSRPETHQIREHNRMRRLGELVEVLDSLESVDALLA